MPYATGLLSCLSVLSVTLVYCGHMVKWINMPLGTEVGLGPSHIVLDGDPVPLPKKGTEPSAQFSANVYCGQTAGWIKMALGMEVCLGPGHIVLDGEPAPLPQKGDRAPNFWPVLLSPNGWMNQNGTWHGVGPWSKPHCARWGPSFPPQNGADPQFSVHFYCRQTAG